jgi:hypothetical protein
MGADDPFAHGLQGRALVPIHQAINFTERGLANK